jgi:DNA-binding transcriptional MerR regulator
MEKLLSIRSLKALGLGLDEIRSVLSSPSGTLEEAIRAQRRHVGQQLTMLTALEARLKQVLELLQREGELGPEDLMKTMGMMTLLEKHFSPDERAYLQARGEALGPEKIQEAQEAWPELIQKMQEEMEKGTDPAAPEMGALALRWRALIEEFSGGNEEVAASLAGMYNSEPGLAEVQGLSKELFRYVGQALSALEE